MRSLQNNTDASAVPMILYVLTIVGCGGLYTLFFIEVFFPTVSVLIPASEPKTFIMMCFYAIPLIILIVGVIAVIKAGLKRDSMYGG